MKKRIEAWGVFDRHGLVTAADSKQAAASYAKEWAADCPDDAPHRVVRLIETDPARDAVVRAVLKHLDALTGVGAVGEIREVGLRLRAIEAARRKR